VSLSAHKACPAVDFGPIVTAVRPDDCEARRPSQIHVLIAHSDPVISAGLTAIFGKRRDFRVVVPRSDRIVSRRAASESPVDVVVADYESGLRLAAGEPTWRGRVVILTHSDGEAMICQALERGARGYLLLGCSLPDLVGGIRAVHDGGVAVGPLVARRIAEKMKQKALTGREEATLRLMMVGLSNKRIAQKLAVTEGTVKAYVKSILGKLKAMSRTEAAAIAQRRGILPEENARHAVPLRLPGVEGIMIGVVTGSEPPAITRPAVLGVRIGAISKANPP
jgi:DNA-binding NarL/FixJ family response regulator